MALPGSHPFLLLLFCLPLPSLNPSVHIPLPGSAGFSAPSLSVQVLPLDSNQSKGREKPNPNNPTPFEFIKRAHSSWNVPRRKSKTQSPRGAVFQSDAALYLPASTCFSCAGRQAGETLAGCWFLALGPAQSSADPQLCHHLCCCCCCTANTSPPAHHCSSGLGQMGLVFHLVAAFLLLLECLPCLSCNSLTSFHLQAVAFF